MKKIFFGVLLVALNLPLVGATVLAEDPADPMSHWGRTYTSNHIIGMMVQNPQGEDLGRIDYIVIDSRGHVPFVVVSHGEMWGLGGKAVAVPYSALTYNRTGRHFTLDIAKEKFLIAPEYKMRDLSNEKWAGEVYRYFGQHPYWTEGESIASEPMGTTAGQYEYP
jgi:hypothetical protein